MLQLAELGIAAVFVDVSVHLTTSGVLLPAAGVLVALSFTAQGPVGVLRLCPRPLHVLLAVGASVVVGFAPILPPLRPDLAGIVVAEFAAIGLIRLATLTRTTAADTLTPTTADTLTPTTADTLTPTTADTLTRTAGANTFGASPGAADAATGRRAAPAPTVVTDPDQQGQVTAGPASPAATPASAAPIAEQTARTAVAAVTIGRHAAKRYGPLVEARTRRAAREAGLRLGRMQRRVAGPPAEPDGD